MVKKVLEGGMHVKFLSGIIETVKTEYCRFQTSRGDGVRGGCRKLDQSSRWQER